jgi:hypothetical protein
MMLMVGMLLVRVRIPLHHRSHQLAQHVVGLDPPGRTSRLVYLGSPDREIIPD